MTTFGASSNNTRFSMLNVARPLSTRAEFAADIRRNWLNALEATVQVGRRLIEAKETLPHGEYEAMIEQDLPFKASTARKLREVAAFVDSNKIPLEQLPDAYSTVYAIATMPEKQLREALDQGVIRPDVTREEVLAFKQPAPAAPAALPVPTPAPASAPAAECPQPERRAMLGRGLEALFTGAAPDPLAVSIPASLPMTPTLPEFRPAESSADVGEDDEEGDPPTPLAEDVMARPWRAGEPGEVVAELPGHGTVMVLAVDPMGDSGIPDTAAARIAEYIVNLHNARLMAGRACPEENAP